MRVDRVILDDIATVVDQCDDSGVAALLGKVCDLYALTNIDADRGWFMEHGHLSATRSEAVVKA